MVINRELQPVEVLTYEGLDRVGQKRMGEPTTKTVDMFIKIYSQSNVADPRYVDIDLIGLTKDFTINTSQIIKVNNSKYTIKYTIPSGKYLQVFMKKTNG